MIPAPMVPLDLTPDPTAFESWTAVAALAVMVAGGVAMRWLSVMKRENTETKEQVDKLVISVTKNNGGDSVKDRFDRIEAKLDQHLEWSDAYVREQNERITALEARPQPRGLFGRRK